MAIHNIEILENTHKDAAFSNNVFFHMQDRKDRKKKIKFDAYLFGVLEGITYKIQNKYHGFIIITGAVGSGKSTLAQGLSAVYGEMNNEKFQLNNIVWTSEKFVAKTDDENNIGEIILWDEAITGATGRKMGLTSQGDDLKNALVTKRFKRHLYILLVDEVEEYSWKLIKMAQAWIDVKAYGADRGHFDVYTKKKKIKDIYLDLKIKKKMPFILPDHKGKFMDFTDMFIDDKEYNSKKMSETRQQKDKSKEKTPKQIIDDFQYVHWRELRETGKTWAQIAEYWPIETKDAARMWYNRQETKRTANE